jgi:hypothetical protein
MSANDVLIDKAKVFSTVDANMHASIYQHQEVNKVSVQTIKIKIKARAEALSARRKSKPKFNIHCFRRADLKNILPILSGSAMSCQLKQLDVFGLIKRVTNSNRYYMTKPGRITVAACERVTEFTIVPALAGTALQTNSPQKDIMT